MKLSLALGPKKPLSRQMAWGCLTTNLAMPGFGSLIGGRAVGYFQIPFTLVGFAMTTIFGIKTIVWYFANFARIQRQDDPVENLLELWTNFRLPLLGIAIFAFAILWAYFTSRSIIAEARKAELLNPRPLPPKLSEFRPLPPKLDSVRPLPPKIRPES
jgi:hypothetical protein